MAEKLTVRQERTVAALLTEPTIAQAAVKAGVGERSVSRWLREDRVFQDAYRRERRRVFEQTISQLTSLCGVAVKELRKVLEDDTASRRDKLRAAALVLEHSHTANSEEVEALFERLQDALESRGVDLNQRNTTC